MLGKRKDTGPAHNMVLTFIGASLLWVGWFGFNAGSAVTAGMQAGMAMTVTQIATAAAGFTWMIVEWIHARQADRHRHLLRRGRRPRRHHAGLGLRRPDRLALRSASPPASSATGAAPASSTCSATTTRSTRSACTRVGGIVGALLTGVFAVEQYGGTAGLIEGNAGQVHQPDQRRRHRVRLRRDRVADHPQDRRHRHRPARQPRRSSAKASISRCTARPCNSEDRRGGDPAASPPSRGPVARRGLFVIRSSLEFEFDQQCRPLAGNPSGRARR